MKEEVQAEFPDRSITIEWMLLDLGSFRSAKEFTVAFRERNLPLHILINNAGIALAPFSECGLFSHSLSVVSLSPCLLNQHSCISLFLHTCSDDRGWL